MCILWSCCVFLVARIWYIGNLCVCNWLSQFMILDLKINSSALWKGSIWSIVVFVLFPGEVVTTSFSLSSWSPPAPAATESAVVDLDWQQTPFGRFCSVAMVWWHNYVEMKISIVSMVSKWSGNMFGISANGYASVRKSCYLRRLDWRESCSLIDRTITDSLGQIMQCLSQSIVDI